MGDISGKKRRSWIYFQGTKGILNLILPND